MDTQRLVTGKGFTVVSVDLSCSESFNPFKSMAKMSEAMNKAF